MNHYLKIGNRTNTSRIVEVLFLLRVSANAPEDLLWQRVT